MEESEQQQQVEQQEQAESVEAFNLKKYNELKANSVSKEEHDKLKQAYKDLFNSYANGEQLSTESPKAQKKTAEELRKELFYPKKELNNLEYVSKALELREAVLEETGEDCFVAKGHHVQPTAESYAVAERTAQILQECIDYADGNSEVFTNELQRRMPNDSPIINKKLRR